VGFAASATIIAFTAATFLTNISFLSASENIARTFNSVGGKAVRLTPRDNVKF
jgi:hypothetical protein